MGRTNISYTRKDEHQKCFDAIKRVIGRELFLAHLDFNAPFDINTDASKLQIGAVISQNGNPIAFYSLKMNSAQQNYTKTEKELFSIVATLKEFFLSCGVILLGAVHLSRIESNGLALLGYDCANL